MAISPRTLDGKAAADKRCEDCFARKDQARRHLHFLKFPDDGALGGHLRAQYGEAAELDGTIGAILGWVRSIKERYRDLVDEYGVVLPAWEAWEASARQCDSQPTRNFTRKAAAFAPRRPDRRAVNPRV